MRVSRSRCRSRCPTCATPFAPRTGGSAALPGRAPQAVEAAQGGRSTAFRSRSFTLAPDTAVGLTQHLGLSPRWLDHVPIGGASGVVSAAPRGACRAGGRRRRRRLRRRRHQPRRLLSPDARQLQPVRARRGLSVRLWRTELRSSPSSPRYYMRTLRRDARGLRQALRRPARPMRCRFPHALFKKPLTLEEYMAARPIADPFHLFDCVMPCAGADALPGDERGARAQARPAATRGCCGDHRAAQRLRRRSGAGARRLGASIATISTRRPA